MTPPLGAALLLALLVILKIAQRVLDGKEINEAEAMLHAGETLGVFVLAASVATEVSSGQALARAWPWYAAFAGVGIVLLLAGSRVLARLLVPGLAVELDRGNRAAGVVAASHGIASSLLVAASAGGQNAHDLGVSAAFFGIGLVTIALFSVLFRALTSYDDAAEVKGENAAAAISYAGAHVATAIIVARACEGEFVAWVPALRSFGMTAAAALALYPVRVLVVGPLLLGLMPKLRGGPLDERIVARSVPTAAAEALTYLGTALLAARLL